MTTALRTVPAECGFLKVFAPDPAPERRPEAGHRLLQRPASEPAAATCGRKSEEPSKLVQVAASGVWVFRIQGSSFLCNSWKLQKVLLTFPRGEWVVWTSAGQLSHWTEELRLMRKEKETTKQACA